MRVCLPAIRGERALGGHAMVGGRRESGVWSELLVVGQDVPLLPSVAGLSHLRGLKTFLSKPQSCAGECDRDFVRHPCTSLLP